ncbi:DNA polymerase III subunit beta [Cryptosporangium aurantiacum]|uniref:Beta sliding clamp n=1 Tax=Cryptosporangium aurantiacum TaxID=134849 RepID=A0A1M7RKZ7_9ACTN|nr:DNA polymerase III subunit beta [Cryptosporangium aurantiacum]SHN46826.1 DNA polymerase III, beta subunit [Cryptosporangium aurantiacum]
MKFRVERESLADAVAWTAKSLPARPPVPVLAGVLLETDNDRLTVSGFDYEVSSQMGVDVQTDTPGRVLVSGRLLAEITRALPNHPVELEADEARAEIVCGTARFTLPTMPVEDYPTLPEMPTVAGAVDADEFATSVAQVVVAAGKDDTLPVLTGVRLELEGDRLTLLATDRYRLAVRELTWRPGAPDVSQHALVPARTLSDTARAMSSGTEVTLALSQGTTGEGLIGFSGAGRRTTTRLLDGQFPPVRSLFPDSHAIQAKVPTATMIEVVKRVSLVAERNTPVRLAFTSGMLTVEAGGTEDARASESTDAVFDGEDIEIAFNPQFLLDGLNALGTEVAVLSCTTPLKPAVLTGEEADAESKPVNESAYRYLLMPVRVSQ